MAKPILVFPHHDPHGKFESIFLKNVAELKNIFKGICLSSTNPTVKSRNDFLKELEANDIYVFRNECESNLGDHHRNALRIGLHKFKGEDIYFGYLDRILFALETKHKDDFIKDVTAVYSEPMTVFSRSECAWNSHPPDYQAIEKIVTNIGRVFFNREMDWTWCGALIKNNLAETILENSIAEDMSILTEMILINLNKGNKVVSVAVDWLEWEDPYWDKKNKNDKYPAKAREHRLNYCLNAMKLFQAEWLNHLN